MRFITRYTHSVFLIHVLAEFEISLSKIIYSALSTDSARSRDLKMETLRWFFKLKLKTQNIGTRFHNA